MELSLQARKEGHLCPRHPGVSQPASGRAATSQDLMVGPLPLQLWVLISASPGLGAARKAAPEGTLLNHFPLPLTVASHAPLLWWTGLRLGYLTAWPGTFLPSPPSGECRPPFPGCTGVPGGLVQGPGAVQGK